MYDEKYSSKRLYPTPKFSLLSALVLVLVSFMIVGGGCGGGGGSSGSSEDNNTPKSTQVMEPNDYNADEIAGLKTEVAELEAEVAEWKVKAEAEKPCPTCPTKTCPTKTCPTTTYPTRICPTCPICPSYTRPPACLSGTELDNKTPDELPSYPPHDYGTCENRSIAEAELHGNFFRSWSCNNNEFLDLRFYNPDEWRKDKGFKTFSGYTQGFSAHCTLNGDHTYTPKNCNLSVDVWKEGVDNWEAEVLSLNAHNMVLIDKDTNTIEHCYQN